MRTLAINKGGIIRLLLARQGKGLRELDLVAGILHDLWMGSPKRTHLLEQALGLPGETQEAICHKWEEVLTQRESWRTLIQGLWNGNLLRTGLQDDQQWRLPAGRNENRKSREGNLKVLLKDKSFRILLPKEWAEELARLPTRQEHILPLLADLRLPLPKEDWWKVRDTQDTGAFETVANPYETFRKACSR